MPPIQIPAQDFIQNLASTSKPSRTWEGKTDPVLENASSVVWNSFNHRPIRAIVDDDFTRAEEGILVWEQKLGTTTVKLSDLRTFSGGYLVLDTLFALRHAALVIPRPQAFTDRVMKLRNNIMVAVLTEKRQRFGDAGLLTSYAKQISKNVLETRVLPVHWATSELPFILSLLELWPASELTQTDLMNSSIMKVLVGLVGIAAVPTSSVHGNPRQRALKILHAWSRSGLTSDLILASEPEVIEFNPPLECRLGEVVEVLKRLSDATGERDSQTIVSISHDIRENWCNSVIEFSLKMCIISAVAAAAKSFGDAPSEAQAVLEQLLDILRTGPQPTHSKDFGGFSYNEFASREQFEVLFIDATWALEGPHPPSWDSIATRPSIGTWDPIHLSISALEPAQHLFDRFFDKTSRLHRHPLFPLRNATFQRREIGQGFGVSAGKWAQGIFGSLFGLQDLSKEITVEYIRGPEYDISFQSPQVLALPAWRRILVLDDPPPNWILPISPKCPYRFIEVDSMGFVGSGSDFHRNLFYPPVISTRMWIPKSWEDVGLSPWNVRTRNPCKIICVEKKWSLGKDGLSEDQSRAMLGRTVQYCLPGSEEVFIAFVWGFDPGLTIVKAFENYHGAEIIRTFLVGKEEQVESDIPGENERPGDYPILRLPVRPGWMGLVEWD
ncbi:hypothetical protein C8J56DRAFT_937726 [Mycena floridula]|nr:hypothetical protein C8J56DRAFT_937726 [Mycena floridula]